MDSADTAGAVVLELVLPGILVLVMAVPMIVYPYVW